MLTYNETDIVKQRQISLLFIVLAGTGYGYGHLNRCLSLAKLAAKRNLKASIMIVGDDAVVNRAKETGLDCCVQDCSVLDIGRFFNEWSSSFSGHFDVIVTDFSHQAILADLESVRNVFKKIRSSAKKIMIIDALGAQAIATRIPDLPIDLLVVPYVGATYPENTHWKLLTGPEYAVLSSVYSGLDKRLVRKNADRILVSCGGSDPKNLTMLVMKGVELIFRTLDVRIIIGPLFSNDTRVILNEIASRSAHSIELINAPDSLVEHMMWCDIAIATTGLIKYELAATSTPGILISIDEVHDLINQPFAKIGSSIDMGVSVSSQQVSIKVSNLLENYEERLKMAEVGREIIDGNGTSRIIDEIIQCCNVDN